MAIAKEEDVDLTDEQLDAISDWGCDDVSATWLKCGANPVQKTYRKNSKLQGVPKYRCYK